MTASPVMTPADVYTSVRRCQASAVSAIESVARPTRINQFDTKKLIIARDGHNGDAERTYPLEPLDESASFNGLDDNANRHNQNQKRPWISHPSKFFEFSVSEWVLSRPQTRYRAILAWKRRSTPSLSSAGGDKVCFKIARHRYLSLSVTGTPPDWVGWFTHFQRVESRGHFPAPLTPRLSRMRETDTALGAIEQGNVLADDALLKGLDSWRDRTCASRRCNWPQ